METGWRSQGECGQWNREADCLNFQMVSGEDEHAEVCLSAACSGNSCPPPRATVLGLASRTCVLQGRLLRLEPTQDPSLQPQVSKETMSVASLNRLGEVVPVVPSSISKSWTQILFSWHDHAA